MRIAPVLVLVLVPALGTLASCGDSAREDGAAAGAEREASRTGPAFDLADVGVASGLTDAVRSGTPAQRYIVEVKSTGVALLDFDGDGRLDVLFSGGSTIAREREGRPGHGLALYRNLGGLRFERVGGLPETRWACAPVCADHDGDGDVDVFVTCFGANVMLRNDDGRLVDVTAESGVAGADDEWSTSAVFHDLDGDGDLDLYVCNYLHFDLSNPPEDGRDGVTCRWKGKAVMCGPRGLPPQRDRCFRNDGGGRFTDVTVAWGLEAVAPAYGLGVVAGDFDRDGSPEIYVANDGMPNYWLEREDGKLVEEGYFKGVAWSEAGAPQAGMGVSAGDVNGDGLEDLVCTNFSGESNDLYLSLEAGLYREGSATAGVALDGLDMLGWGCGLRDFDLDGRLDLFVANGHVYTEAAEAGTGTDYPQPNQLFLQTRPGRFEKFAVPRGSGLGVRRVSRGAAFGDLDDDGDEDVVVVNLNARPSLLENRLDRARTGRHFVGIELRASSPNRAAIGARVTVTSGGVSLAREVRRQESFQASSDPRLRFGVSRRVDAVIVTWPDGVEETFDVAVDSYNALERGKGRR